MLKRVASEQSLIQGSDVTDPEVNQENQPGSQPENQPENHGDNEQDNQQDDQADMQVDNESDIQHEFSDDDEAQQNLNPPGHNIPHPAPIQPNSSHHANGRNGAPPAHVEAMEMLDNEHSLDAEIIADWNENRNAKCTCWFCVIAGCYVTAITMAAGLAIFILIIGSKCLEFHPEQMISVYCFILSIQLVIFSFLLCSQARCKRRTLFQAMRDSRSRCQRVLCLTMFLLTCSISAMLVGGVIWVGELRSSYNSNSSCEGSSFGSIFNYSFCSEYDEFSNQSWTQRHPCTQILHLAANANLVQGVEVLLGTFVFGVFLLAVGFALPCAIKWLN